MRIDIPFFVAQEADRGIYRRGYLEEIEESSISARICLISMFPQF
jgi:hypothetical protein